MMTRYFRKDPEKSLKQLDKRTIKANTVSMLVAMVDLDFFFLSPDTPDFPLLDPQLFKIVQNLPDAFHQADPKELPDFTQER